MDFAADLAKQWRKNVWRGLEVSKHDFCLQFYFWCVLLFILIYSFHAFQRHARLEIAPWESPEQVVTDRADKNMNTVQD